MLSIEKSLPLAPRREYMQELEAVSEETRLVNTLEKSVD